MGIKLCIRYKIDLSALDDQNEPKGFKEDPKTPIGEPSEYVGTAEDIKKKICAEIDNLYLKIEELYYNPEA